jgi:hypothetical protein
MPPVSFVRSVRHCFALPGAPQKNDAPPFVLMRLLPRPTPRYNSRAVGGRKCTWPSATEALGHGNNPGRGCRSGDPHHFPGLHALGTDSHAPRRVIHHDLGSLQVGQPPALRARSAELPGAAMNVPDILPVLGALVADMASLSQSWHLLSAGMLTSHHSTAGARFQGKGLYG